MHVLRGQGSGAWRDPISQCVPDTPPGAPSNFCEGPRPSHPFPFLESTQQSSPTHTRPRGPERALPCRLRTLLVTGVRSPEVRRGPGCRNASTLLTSHQAVQQRAGAQSDQFQLGNQPHTVKMYLLRLRDRLQGLVSLLRKPSFILSGLVRRTLRPNVLQLAVY